MSLSKLFFNPLQKIIKAEHGNLAGSLRTAIPLSLFMSLAGSKRDDVIGGVGTSSTRAAKLLEKTIHDGLGKKIGILSLTENPSNLLMWAHYANSNQGFVIAFDSSHEFFLTGVLARKTNYAMLGDSDKTIRASPCDVPLVKIPFEAINAVIVGARASENTICDVESSIAPNPKLKHINI